MITSKDNEIIRSKKILIQKYGINCCSSSAATFSAAKKLIVDKKLVNKNILLLLTGSGFKD